MGGCRYGSGLFILVGQTMSEHVDMERLRRAVGLKIRTYQFCDIVMEECGPAILELIEAAVKAYHSSIGIDVDPIGPEQDEQRLWNAVQPFIEEER